MVEKYKKKPCEIEAVQWNGTNLKEIKEFVGKDLSYDIGDTPINMEIHTLEGNMIASYGDYIIKGLRGEFYPCKPDVFEKKYELVEDRAILDDLETDLNEYDKKKENRLNESTKAEFVSQVIEIFESFLDDRNIVLDNYEKEDDEDAANIYGSDYGELQTGLEDLIDRWGIENNK